MILTLFILAAISITAWGFNAICAPEPQRGHRLQLDPPEVEQ